MITSRMSLLNLYQYIPLINDQNALEPDKEYIISVGLMDTRPGLVIGPTSSAALAIIDDDGKLIYSEAYSPKFITKALYYLNCSC